MPSSQQNDQKTEVTTRVTGINYNCNVFFFFINRNITINTYFIKMLLGWIELLKEISE